MNLSEIKKKYRDILLESQNSSSSSDFETEKDLTVLPFSYASVPQRHQRAQSVANKQNHSGEKRGKPSISLHTEIIHLKERLGQANQKLESKKNELKSECDRKSEINQEKRVLEKHLMTYSEQIEKKDKQLIELKASRIGFEHKIKELEEKYMDKDLDKELLKKQISFYELEQKKFREVLKGKDEEIRVLNGKVKAARELESENQRLKKDVNKLAILLEDKKIFKPTKNFNMSYLGRNIAESDCWFNRDIIASAQHFLNKHKINQKPILHGLTKLLESVKNSPSSTSNISSTSHNLKKSLSRKSRSKGRRDSSVTCKDISVILPRNTTSSKMCVSTSVYQPFLHHSKSKSKTKSGYKQTIEEEEKVFSCRDIIREYKAGIDELLEKNACSKGKIKKLTEWLVSSVDNIIKDDYINFY